MAFTLVKSFISLCGLVPVPLTFPPPLKLSLGSQGKGEKHSCRKGKHDWFLNVGSAIACGR